MVKRAFIYPRVSSDKQTHGDSVEEQTKSCIKRALEHGYKNNEIEVYAEKGSGRNEHRPKFEEMLHDARQNKHVEKIYIWDIDRLTRAGVKHYTEVMDELTSMGIDLIDIAGIIQPSKNLLEGSGGIFGEDFKYDWSVCRPSKSAEIQRAQEAENEARKILHRTLSPLIKNTQDGYEARDSIYGFQNVKIFIPETGKRKTTREIFPEEAELVREMYELTARGVAPEIISERLNKKGFKTRTRNQWSKYPKRRIGKIGGEPLTPRRIWTIIEKVAYAGFKQEKWTRHHLIEAKHPPIVPLDLWNEANKNKQQIKKSSLSPTGWKLEDLREGKKRVYIQERPEYRFKKLILCPECGKPMKGSASRGKSGKRFPAYHCDRNHKRVALNAEKLEDLVRDQLKEMQFAPETARLLDLSVSELWKLRVPTLNKDIMNTADEIQELRQKANLISENITYLSVPALIKQKEQEYLQIQQEIEDLENNRNQKEYKEKDVLAILKNARHFVEHLDEFILDTDDSALLGEMWKLLFTQTPTLEEIKSGTPQISPVVELKEMLNSSENSVAAPRGIEPRLQE